MLDLDFCYFRTAKSKFTQAFRFLYNMNEFFFVVDEISF